MLTHARMCAWALTAQESSPPTVCGEMIIGFEDYQKHGNPTKHRTEPRWREMLGPYHFV